MFQRHPWLNHTILGAGRALLCEIYWAGKDLPSLKLPKSSEGSWNPRAKWFHPLLVCWQLSYSSEPCQRCLRGVWLGWISLSRLSFLARYQRKLQTPKLILAPIHSRRKKEHHHQNGYIGYRNGSEPCIQHFREDRRHTVRKSNQCSHKVSISISFIHQIIVLHFKHHTICQSTAWSRLHEHIC